MKRELRRIFAFLYLGAFLFIRCSVNPLQTVGGGGVEGEGRIAGTIIDENGASALYTQVRLVPADFDPQKNSPIADSMIEMTDVNGTFQFSNVPAGLYCIEGLNFLAKSRALIWGFRL